MFYVKNPIENANYLRDLNRFALFLPFKQIYMQIEVNIYKALIE